MKSLLESTLNTRELGGYACEGGVTAGDSILRSDRICQPTERDKEYLRERGITTVIDLRTVPDAEQSPCGLRGEEGFFYHHLPVEEGGYVPARFEDVVPSYLMIARAANMAEVFGTIAAAPKGVIFNCWAGKDRTGVVSAILLMLCGVSDEDIIADYLLTGAYSEQLWKEMRAVSSEERMRIVLPCRDFIEGFLRLFRENFGSAEGYLLSLGLTAEQIAAVRGKLVRDSGNGPLKGEEK